MTNSENDLLDLDPTEADLFAPVDEDEDDDLFPEDDDDLDFDSNLSDDRWGTASNGMPSYSIYGSL